MLALLFLLLDLAWVLLAWGSIEEGAREGVRFAITGQTGSFPCQDAAIRDVVRQYSFGFVTSKNLDSSVGVDYYSPSDLSTPLAGAGSNRGGNVVKISVRNIPISPLAALWRSSSPVTLSASSSDVVEGSPNAVPPCR